MSMIKRFFEKKKADAKFKLAGSGQKLGDANAAAQAAQRQQLAGAAASSRSASSGSGKGQLSQEQRLAASAALERFSASQGQNSEDFEKRRSQAAIRAQAKKELEKEQAVEKEVQQLRDTYGEKPVIELEAQGSNAILYKCPLIGDQVLPKEEMRQAIRSFLYSQVAEEPGLTSCLIIYTLNKDSEKVSCFTFFLFMMDVRY